MPERCAVRLTLLAGVLLCTAAAGADGESLQTLPESSSFPHLERQGTVRDGGFVPRRRLNGDQSHQGRHLRIPMGQYGMQRVRLYRYR